MDTKLREAVQRVRAYLDADEIKARIALAGGNYLWGDDLRALVDAVERIDAPGTFPWPDRDEAMPAEQQGLFRKFHVRRVDGSDEPGGKHFGCNYFVLDLTHDQHAPAAMRAYAQSCQETHPELAQDIVDEFGASEAGSFTDTTDFQKMALRNGNWGALESEEVQAAPNRLMPDPIVMSREDEFYLSNRICPKCHAHGVRHVNTGAGMAFYQCRSRHCGSIFVLSAP